MERRAFIMARIASDDSDDACDIVQDAMLDFVRRYAHRPEEEWKPLFYRIVQSRIIDWYRRTTVRSRFRAWLGHPGEDDEREDPLAQVADTATPDAAELLSRQELSVSLDKAIRSLPLRQQQAVLLRVWEELDVAQTATAMGCSQGSVKTHFFRALQALRKIVKGEDL